MPKILQKLAVSENPILKIINKILHIPFDLADNVSSSLRKDKRQIRLIKKICMEKEMRLRIYEAFQLASCVTAAQKIEGDIAEVGVYYGASSKLICELKGDKHLHLFDTFEGLPYSQSFDKILDKGYCAAPLEGVREYLAKYEKVYFYKGVFPEESSHAVEAKKFSFVHIDVDLYKSTLGALAFFYPRMAKGGIMLLHDYPLFKDVKNAVDEFFTDKPEAAIELSTEQCLIVKL